MKIAILSDAHGNDYYFNKCINEIQKIIPDRIIFLGDCFGYMRKGNIILTKLRQLDTKILMGNHEAMLLGKIPYNEDKEAVYGLKIDRKNITESNLEYIKNLEPEFCEEIDDKKILFVHGRPDNPLNGYLYEDDKTFDWSQSQYDLVFMGHTHRPYIKKAGKTIYVNVGSCGLPRDKGTAPSYAVFDTCNGETDIYRVSINKTELKELALENIHPEVYECLMRERNIL